MTCGDTQNIIKNYASVIQRLWQSRASPTPASNRIRQLAQRTRRRNQSVRLVRASSHKLQAPSLKLQATSLKSSKLREASLKPRGASVKLQASSIKLLDKPSLIKFYKVKGEVLNHDKCIVRMSYMK